MAKRDRSDFASRGGAFIKTLMVGATGHLGGIICRRLLGRGSEVTALVRPGAQLARVEALDAAGAKIVRGDLKDHRSLAAACVGQQAVVSTATSVGSSVPGDTIESVDREGHLKLIAAAEAAGVRHFVFVSFSSNVEPAHPSPLTAAKRVVETRLRDCGLAYTVLRSSILMDVWLVPARGFDHAQGTVTIYGPGVAPLSWIDSGDVAEFAVKCLEHEGANRALVDLGGPEALSHLEVVGIFEALSGRRFTLTHVPIAPFEEQRRSAADPLQRSMAGLILQMAAGDVIDMSDTSRRFGVRLTSVRDYAQRVPGAGNAGPVSSAAHETS